MNDPELMIRPMPPSAIIKDFVEGASSCYYELYLRELINSSTYFLNKGRSRYRKPLSEEASQCDALSEEYELDFKLLDSQTKLMADSILKKRPAVLAPGLMAYTECKKPGGKVMATNLHVAIRGLSVNDLKKIRRTKTNHTSIKNDIPQVLEVTEVKKNVLMLFPYIFSFKQEAHPTKPIETIGSAMNNDFRNLFLYREEQSPGFDSYLTTVFSGSFLIFEIIRGEFSLIESISIDNTPTYKRLIEYSDTWG